MKSGRTFSSFSAAAAFVAVLTATVLVAPVRAADAIFPLGSRVGLVPPPGMSPSEAFNGFADPDKDAAILIAVLPPDAYAQFEKSINVDALKKQGVSVEKREPMQLSFGKGILFSGRQVAADKNRYRKWLLVASASDFTALVTVQVPEQDKTYSDRAVHAALASLSMRDKVPDSEELSLLPFTVGDLAGFHIDGVLRGRALMLSDRTDPGDTGKPPLLSDSNTHLLIAVVPGGPQELDDRANFARQTFAEIGGLKDVQITMSESLRIVGQPGYQTMADAKDAGTGEDVRVVQWLRFGNGGYLQMVGVARSAAWAAALARLRTVRDSIDAK